MKHEKLISNIIATVLVVIIFINHGIAQESQLELSKNERIADFNYLFEELEKSYPYFHINERVTGVDWLGSKKRYLEKIKATENDKEFFIALTYVLNELNNDHTDTYPTIIYDYFHRAYQGAVSQDSSYMPYLEELNKTDSLRCKYWELINADIFSEKQRKIEASKDNEKEELNKENVLVFFEDSLSTAIITIGSFSYDLIDKDKNKLRSFIEKAFEYDNIIIDIQGNSGGDTDYWMLHIVPYLIEEEISFPFNYAFKNSDRIKYFKPSYFTETIDFEDMDFPELPEEIKTKDYLLRQTEIIISPNPEAKSYRGNIFLLVDKGVYSSAETFAYFCKSTGFATIVGQKTGGDGVGTDPLLLTLPNSGIIIRFTGELGLNPDGSANEEAKTIPDIKIEAQDNHERQIKLLQYIQKN